MTTIILLLSIASWQNWFLHQLDINTAFLHGDLEEEVYMKILPGLKVSNRNLVCKLKRSMYGLKQSSRQWNHKLTNTLISLGYCQSKSDYSLFTKKTDTFFTTILVYVDGLVLAGNNIIEINNIKIILDNTFSIKDLGNLKYFLGFEVARNFHGISLCQHKYSLDILQETCLLPAKLASTPMDPSHNLHCDKVIPLSTHTPFRSLIGKLIYLTHSRHGISFLFASPAKTHMHAPFRIIRYIKNAPALGIYLKHN